jgi:hypothetical protein
VEGGRLSFSSYTVIAATRGTSLTLAERHVLTHMAMRAGEEGRCWASQATIAEDTGLTDRTVRTAVSGLRAKGILVYQGDGPNHTDIYTFDLAAIVRCKGKPHTGERGRARTPEDLSGAALRKPLPENTGNDFRSTPEETSDNPSLDPSLDQGTTPPTPSLRDGAVQSVPPEGRGLVEPLRAFLQLHPDRRALGEALDNATAKEAKRWLDHRRALPIGTPRKAIALALQAAARMEPLPAPKPLERRRPEPDEEAPPELPNDLRPLWDDVLREMTSRIGAQDVDIWLKGTCVPFRLAAGELWVWLPNRYYVEWVGDEYLDHLRDITQLDVKLVTTTGPPASTQGALALDSPLLTARPA